MPLTNAERLKLLMGDDQLPMRTEQPLETMSENAERSIDEAIKDPKETVPASAALPEEDKFKGVNFDNLEMINSSSSEEGSTSGRTFTIRRKLGKQRSTGGQINRDSAQVQQSTMIDRLAGNIKDNQPAQARSQLSPPDYLFCPLKAVQKYPYRYVSKQGQDKVSRSFFARGRFWDRAWNIYYIYPPAFSSSSSSKPLLFVSALQAQAFLDTINTTLDTQLVFPYESEEVGFLLRFSDDHTPRPRYLGRCISKMEFDKLESMIPDETFKPEGHSGMPKPTDRSLAAFRTKIELALDATKTKSKASRAKKKEERVRRQQAWARQIKRTQRYLGLRQRREEVDAADVSARLLARTTDSADPVLTGERAEAEAEAQSFARTHPTIDVNLPAPFAPDSSVVFICVDVESFERNHNLITEIGIATLDTRDLSGLAPGDGAKDWMSKIRVRHFRVREYGHLRNKVFVEGCADKFEFGNSEWVSIRDAPRVVASCFRHPFSGPDMSTAADEQLEKRNIVLLGHDTDKDISYLSSMGYDPLSNPSLLEILDTASMYRSLKREAESRALGTVLYELDLVGWNLHNAGNDAAYTLQAMLAICFRDLTLHGKSSETKREEREAKIKLAEATAGERARDDCEGWSSAGEGSDGGAPDLPEQNKTGRNAAMAGPGGNHKQRCKANVAEEKAAAQAILARHAAAARENTN